MAAVVAGDVIPLSARTYTECSRRACEVLKRDKVGVEDALFVLSRLPQPKNTRRQSVIPPGETFVYSQSIGLTTQKGKAPSLSHLVAACPNVVKVLTRFVLDYDPGYTFTTITLNYNYAAAAHRDVNHDGGHARIIALGEFEGGGLNLEGVEGPIDIRNKWFDFDGRLLHSTAPFTGERYSLVYFTHEVWKTADAQDIGRTLLAMGVPWPVNNAFRTAVKPSQWEDERVADALKDYVVALPNRSVCPYYESFVLAEFASLIELATSTRGTTEEGNALHRRQPLRLETELPFLYCRGSMASAQYISNRCVSFQTFNGLYRAPTVGILRETLTKNAAADATGCPALPPSYILEIVAAGKKISTRQRRKITMELNLPRATPPTDQSGPCLLVLFLVYEKSGVLSSVYLFEQVRSVTNEFSSAVVTKKTLHKGGKHMSGVIDEKSPTQFVGEALPATPLRPALTVLMCNLALVQHCSLCYDPFVGSGSLLSACRRFSATAFGADVSMDNMFLHLRDGEERILSNAYTPPLRGGSMLDAIVCDPPYGRREKHVDQFGRMNAKHETNAARALAQFEILTPLFAMASQNLRVGGRLVFAFFNFPKSTVPGVYWDITDLPQHKNLRVEHRCREQWEKSSGHVLARDIVTVVKVSHDINTC